MSETNYPLKGKSVFGDRLVRDGNKIVFGPNERPDIGKPGALYRTVGVNSFDGLGNVVGKNVIRDYHEIEDIYKTLKIMGVTGSRMYPAYYGFRSGETDYTGPDGWGNKLAILDKDAKEIIWSESAFKKYDWSGSQRPVHRKGKARQFNKMWTIVSSAFPPELIGVLPQPAS